MDDLETIIFRTDRIGDFIISCPFIISYKKKFYKNPIKLVSSDYNFNYVNKFPFIKKTIPLKSKVRIFPKIFVLLKMILLLRKNNYKDIIILDGKARSFFISLFLKGNKSILLQSKRIKLLSKIFKYKIVENNEVHQQVNNFSFLANVIGFKISNKNPNIYENLLKLKKFNFNKNYIILHIDEKWYSDLYYKDFTEINPDAKDFDILIHKISKIIGNNFEILITTGNKEIKNLIDYVSDFKSSDNVKYEKKINSTNVTFLKNLDIDELANLVNGSSLVVCCEGAISHISNNFNIPTLALYEMKKIQHTKFWTGHMRMLSLIKRKKINHLLLDDTFFDTVKKSINVI